MHRILFDHQKFSTQKYGGISRYFANIIQEIAKTDDWEFDLGVLACGNHYLSSQKLALNAFEFLRNPKIAYRINQLYSERLLRKNNFDVFHPTYYDPYFIGKTTKPVVVTIHDMTYERLPEYFWAQDPLSYQKRVNAERADKIIAISETTKTDLLNYLDVDPAKVEVIYHGIDYEEPPAFKPVEGVAENYLLFVGDRSGYKNFYLFMDAFKQLSVKYSDLQVILTGGGPMGIADIELLKRLKLTHRVQHVQVSDEQLNFLYQHALAFVYPSLHEGFGLPILEAFHASCPVILSDTDCFREIGASAAIFFNPHQAEDLSAAIEKLISDSSFRDQLIAAGKERLKDFPLEKSVKDTLTLYSSLI